METETGESARWVARRLREIWRMAMPLWLFRDAGRGTLEQRVANYRYNRSLRSRLPFHMAKWMVIALCLMQLMRVLSTLMAITHAQTLPHICAAVFCMSAGIGFAFACVVLAVLLASYLHFSYVQH